MSVSPKTMLPLIALLAVALVPVAVSAQAQRRDARTEIPALNAKLTAAYNAGHPETMAQAYAADAVVMPPNGPALRGAKAIADWWNGSWQAGARNAVLTSREVYVEGNLATETGTYAIDVPMTRGGPPVHDSGKYMVLWKRSPTAGWQLYRDIFNSDVPMARMAEGMEPREGTEHPQMSDTVLFSINPIRADKRADYEQWLKEFWSAGMRSSDESVKRRFMAAHVVTPNAANPDGSWTYVIVVHPYHPGEDYSIASLTRQLFAPSDTTLLNALLSGARAAPATVVTGKMMMEGMMPK